MVINSKTKISQLLKQNPEALDAITSLAKPLEKLRNPILRKLMAARTTIEEAADIGGCRVEEFFLALRPLGFEISGPGDTKDSHPANMDTQMEKPAWLMELTPDKTSNFDVRDMLKNGHDPLKEILEEYTKIRPGTTLKVINTFVPTPLLRLLENKGARTFSEKMEERLVYSYFFKPEAQGLSASAQDNQKETRPIGHSTGDLIATVSEAEFKAQLSRFEQTHLKEIDVRHLEMPEPMQTILREAAQLPKDYGLYIHHKRIPVYLLEDLQVSGNYRVLILPIAETQVDLLLMHNPG